jgi:hypothetical protein
MARAGGGETQAASVPAARTRVMPAASSRRARRELPAGGVGLPRTVRRDCREHSSFTLIYLRSLQLSRA